MEVLAENGLKCEQDFSYLDDNVIQVPLFSYPAQCFVQLLIFPALARVHARHAHTHTQQQHTTTHKSTMMQMYACMHIFACMHAYYCVCEHGYVSVLVRTPV